MYVYCTFVSTTLHYVTGSLVANWFDMLSIWVRTTYHMVSNIVKRNCHIYQMSNNTRFVWVVQEFRAAKARIGDLLARSWKN